MPFKMIANRTVYRAGESKEYQKGEAFSVDTEKERDRLIRTRRAHLDDSKPTGGAKTTRRPEPAPIVQKVEKVESGDVSTDDPLLPRSRYRRSDMRSED